MPPLRRAGQPKLARDDQTARTSVRLPAREYDQLCARARQDRQSLSDVLRRGLRYVLATDSRR